jgi:hypothetical protein
LVAPAQRSFEIDDPILAAVAVEVVDLQHRVGVRAPADGAAVLCRLPYLGRDVVRFHRRVRGNRQSDEKDGPGRRRQT